MNLTQFSKAINNLKDEYSNVKVVYTIESEGRIYVDVNDRDWEKEDETGEVSTDYAHMNLSFEYKDLPLNEVFDKAFKVIKGYLLDMYGSNSNKDNG